MSLRTTLGGAIATAMASIGPIGVRGDAHHAGSTRYPAGHKPQNSIAERNRHTGRPHQNKREIARRCNQQGRITANQIDRAKRAGIKDRAKGVEVAAGLTRTGRVVHYAAASQ